MQIEKIKISKFLFCLSFLWLAISFVEMRAVIKDGGDVNKMIHENEWMFIVRESCPYCQRAMKKADELNLAYSTYDISGNDDVLRQASELSKIKTVPQIFFQGHFFGDCTEFLEKMKAKSQESFKLNEKSL